MQTSRVRARTSVRARSCINPNPKYINTYGLYSMNTTSRTSTTISTSS